MAVKNPAAPAPTSIISYFEFICFLKIFSKVLISAKINF
jgi:hypothetical protein